MSPRPSTSSLPSFWRPGFLSTSVWLRQTSSTPRLTFWLPLSFPSQSLFLDAGLFLTCPRSYWNGLICRRLLEWGALPWLGSAWVSRLLVRWVRGISCIRVGHIPVSKSLLRFSSLCFTSPAFLSVYDETRPHTRALGGLCDCWLFAAFCFPVVGIPFEAC